MARTEKRYRRGNVLRANKPSQRDVCRSLCLNRLNAYAGLVRFTEILAVAPLTVIVWIFIAIFDVFGIIEDVADIID